MSTRQVVLAAAALLGLFAISVGLLAHEGSLTGPGPVGAALRGARAAVHGALEQRESAMPAGRTRDDGLWRAYLAVVERELIPASPAIAGRIGAIHVGDQIRMKGLLVDYAVTRDGREIFTRRTSLVRSDTDNGACEILYVTDLSVVARGHHLRADAGRYLGYLSLALLVALAGVWLVRRPFAE